MAAPSDRPSQHTAPESRRHGARFASGGVRGFLSANITGSAMSLAVCAWLLGRAPKSKLTTLLGSIHDAQARALFHGHWNLRFEDLYIEAFKIHGEYQTYFGIWPTLLRMPVLAITNRFDGALTGPSILVAVAVALAASAGIQWELRSMFDAPNHVEAPDPLDRRDHVGVVEVFDQLQPITLSRGQWFATAGFQMMLGTGSVVAFLASYPLVYHEMEMWGIAGGLASAWAVIRFSRAPSVRASMFLCAATAIAILSRPSVGVGVLVTIAVVWILRALRWKRRGASLRHLVTLAVAAMLPLAMFCLMNNARFGTPLSVPLDKQVFTMGDAAHHFPGNPQRQLAMASNHGSLFGLHYLPTTVVQYLRPDAFRFDSQFPFINKSECFRLICFDGAL